MTGVRSLFTLDLARRFREKGHQVFGGETSLHHVCRFSNAFEKQYVIPSPRFQSERFIQKLVDICIHEKIDLVIPSFEEIFCISKGLHYFPKETTVLSSSYETLDILHNKWRFNKKLEALGFDAPESYLIRSQKDLDSIPLTVPYILKPSYSRASQCIQKVTTSTPPKIKIDPRNPLVAQKWLDGKKYCSYSIAHQGKLAAHTVYPVDFSIEGNSCLNFEAINHPKIEGWVRSFVEKESFTGQIAFDFIEVASDKLYAIECNPRGTSGIHLFQEKDDLPSAFFNTQKSLVSPELGHAKKLGWGMILYGWKTGDLLKFARKFLTVEDVIFSRKDLKPSFHQPLLFFIYLFRSFKLRERFPAMFTFDIDWNGSEIIEQEQIPSTQNFV